MQLHTAPKRRSRALGFYPSRSWGCSCTSTKGCRVFPARFYPSRSWGCSCTGRLLCLGLQKRFYPSRSWGCSCTTRSSEPFHKEVSIPAGAGGAAAHCCHDGGLRHEFLSQPELGVQLHIANLTAQVNALFLSQPELGVQLHLDKHIQALFAGFYPSRSWGCSCTQLLEAQDQMSGALFLSQPELGVQLHLVRGPGPVSVPVSIPAGAGGAAALTSGSNPQCTRVSIPAGAGGAAAPDEVRRATRISFYPSRSWGCSCTLLKDLSVSDKCFYPSRSWGCSCTRFGAVRSELEGVSIPAGAGGAAALPPS